MTNTFDFDDIILFLIFMYNNSDSILNEYGGF